MKEYLKKFIKKYWIVSYITILFIIVLFVLMPVSLTYSQIVKKDNKNNTSAQLVNLANQDRTALGLKSLIFDANLQTAAEEKAQDMANNDYFEHFTPSGQAPWKFMIDNGYIYETAGENLAIDFNNIKDIEKAWMESPTHRANILNPLYENIAIATIEDNFQGHKTTIVVQMFGKKSKGLSATTNLVYYKIRSLLGLGF